MYIHMKYIWGDFPAPQGHHPSLSLEDSSHFGLGAAAPPTPLFKGGKSGGVNGSCCLECMLS